MLNKIFIPTIFIILSYGFWLSPDFKEISAGVAIFLFGMISLEQGFKVFTGGALEKLLNISTNTRLKALSFGVVTSSVMQSSSLVSVITISFLSAGLLGLGEGIGIIFGANLGTTTGAWLIAGFGLKVNISAYAMPMLVFGVIMLLQKNNTFKGVGYILSGLGFLFLGIHYMKEGFEAFKSTIDLANLAIEGFGGLFIYAGIGILATVIMQSSHATLVLIITALAANQISYENALALAIGANVGTTITAILSAMSSDVTGKRLAGAHLIFNLVTGALAIIFISQFLNLVDTISASLGIAENDYTLKLALFHTLFNLVGVLVMLPLIDGLVRFLTSYLPSPQTEKIGAKYLNSASIDFPETAVEAIRKETIHIYNLAFEILARGISLKKRDIITQKSLEEVIQLSNDVKDQNIDAEYETKIKGVYSEIIEFISKAQFTWEVEQSASIHWLRSANQNIVEAIKDMKHLRKNMAKYMVSPNIHMRELYDLIRIEIALVMRELDRIKKAVDHDETVVLSLDTLKLKVAKSDDSINQQLIDLLQQKQITATMASSLMNDRQYALRITNNLIEMGATLFSNYNEEQVSAEREVALEPAEIEAIATEVSGDKHER